MSVKVRVVGDITKIHKWDSNLKLGDELYLVAVSPTGIAILGTSPNLKPNKCTVRIPKMFIEEV